MEDKEYDIVIVGAGPSSIGLIFGLLSKYDISNHRADSSSHSGHQKPSPGYNIAVIDRGPLALTKDYPNSSTKDIKQWFHSSHYSPSSSTVYLTPPQEGFGHRTISVPTARGFGGGTNVNAGLVVRPAEDDFVTWPMYWQEQVTVSEPKGSKDDEWCHVMRSRMMASVVKIENEMMQNGALIQEDYKNKTSETRSHCSMMMRANVNRFQKYYEEESDVSELNLTTPPVISAAKWEDGGANAAENHKKARRVNYYEALLEPLLERNPHLKEKIHFYESVQAERILFDNVENGGLVATGVECSLVGTSDGSKDDQSGSFFRVMAKNRVILGGGAILSPSLLLLSGLGNEQELGDMGVTPVRRGQHKWNGIGKNFKDHLVTVKAYFTLPSFPPSIDNVNSVRGWLALDISKKREEGSGAAKEGDKTLPSSATSSRAFLKLMDGSLTSQIIPHVFLSTISRTNNQEGSEDDSSSFSKVLLRIIYYIVYYLLRAILSLPPMVWFLTNCTAVTLVCLLNPESKGCVKVARKDKTESPPVTRLRDYDIVVDPGYLKNERDHDRNEMAWNALDTITSSLDWFQRCLEVLPGPLLKHVWGNSLSRYASDMTQPYFHWSGGCVMKTPLEQDFVVDETLKVRDVANLYVCDASVVPNQLSAPPALTLAGIGYTAAGIFAKELVGKEE